MSRRHKEEIAQMNEKIEFLMESRNNGAESGSQRREIKVECFEIFFSYYLHFILGEKFKGLTQYTYSVMITYFEFFSRPPKVS